MSTKGKNRKNNKEHKIRSDLQLIIDLDPEMIFIKDKKNYMMSTNKNFIGSFKIKNGHIERKTCFQLYPVQAEQYWQDDKERTMFNKDNASAPIITSINFVRPNISEKSIKEKQEIYQILSKSKKQIEKLVYTEEPIHFQQQTNGSWFDIYLYPISNLKQDGTKVAIFARNITKSKETEREVFNTKNFLNNIINSVTEVIIALDQNNRISAWNKTAEKITGYKRSEVLRKSINSLSVFDDYNEILEDIKKIFKIGTKVTDELILRTKEENTKKIIRASYSIIRDINKNAIGTVLIGQDITHKTDNYKTLVTGTSYLVYGKNNIHSLELFTDLIKLDYQGLLITRPPAKNIEDLDKLENCKVLLLGEEKYTGVEGIPDLDVLIDEIKVFCKKNVNTVILLDRIDYIVNRFSFEKLMNVLYKITIIIGGSNTILLLRLNSACFNKEQIAMIEEEFLVLPDQQVEKIILEDELHEILAFVDLQNENHISANYKKISTALCIDKKTLAKRLKKLSAKGLIRIKSEGRIKNCYISEKGKKLLNKKIVF